MAAVLRVAVVPAEGLPAADLGFATACSTGFLRAGFLAVAGLLLTGLAVVPLRATGRLGAASSSSPPSEALTSPLPVAPSFIFTGLSPQSSSRW